MLPPAQVRQGLVLAQRHSLAAIALKASTTSLLRAGISHRQSRSFWGWRRGPTDWSSQLDPLYHRFNRVRTLKTRAKLLKKLQRRGKFEWDVDTKPFFTPRHVRCASHWDARGRRLWYLNDESNKTKRNNESNETKESAAEESEGYELSHREKIWKEQMEAMRKRIESDPYEVIFGKRFEPFWGPLVPSWMREEMGLQQWPKRKEAAAKAREEAKEPSSKTEKSDKIQENIMAAKADTKVVKNETRADVKAETKAEKPVAQASAYSYASSTSWDSWSNKTRRVEWDSVSGQTKKYEYDPISNRMVEVEASQPAKLEDSQKADESQAAASKSKDVPSSAADIATRKSLDTPTVSIPVKQSTEVRKSIPIPPPLSQPWHTIPVGFTAPPTSIGLVKSTAVSPNPTKPSALAKLPEKDLDMLTAERVRASMGKVRDADTNIKPTTAEQKADLERSFDQKPRSDPEVEAILKERDLAKGRMSTDRKPLSQWDQAEMNVLFDRELDSLKRKKEKLLNDERGLFHIERQKRELIKLDGRIKDITTRIEKLNVATSPALAAAPLQTSLQRAEATPKAADGAPLQSSLERMQAKEASKSMTEPDDSAAHESTEPISSAGAHVPSGWSKQADLLQADRVRRTTSKSPYPMPPRWLDDMKAKKAAYEAREASKKAATATADAERAAKLEEANKLLESEVQEQKFRMQAHENRYAHKIKSLREELARAYRQSSVHSDKHLERIRWLEYELEGACKAVGGQGKKDTPAAQAPETVQAEGDLGSNVAKFAKGGDKWYKQAAPKPEPVPTSKKMPLGPAVPKPGLEGLHKQLEGLVQTQEAKHEQKIRDRALVKEVREIYEGVYGVIDTNHRQTSHEARKMPEQKTKQVVEVESDVDLGEELAKYEKEQPYRFQQDNLENEMAMKEREAHEAQHLTQLDSVPRLEKTIVDGLKLGNGYMKLPGDREWKVIPDDRAELAKWQSAAIAEAQAPSIQWEEPPVYKVLAYDSGNDRISTATTTSNFTGTEEKPISIPDALSQLYAPARFVSYFAELQREGYQVIHGTKDLLVFKKVKGVEQAAVGLEDHGLIAPKQDAPAEQHETQPRHPINPVDGTSRSQPTTGNFASPTGFVNHDPVVPPASQTNTSQTSRPSSEPEEDFDLEYRHYPRVRREEAHFTGLRRKWHDSRRHVIGRGERMRRRRKRSTFRWIMGAGLGTAAVMYLVGAAAEKSRKRSTAEEWARRAEEEGRRWR